MKPVLECLRCRNIWQSRFWKKPKQCPGCLSREWQTPGPPPRRSQPGIFSLYIAQTADRKFIKVGVSTNTDKRKLDLESDARVKLGVSSRLSDITYLVVLKISRPEQMEADILRRFALHRIPRTEWFRAAPEIYAYIDGLRALVPATHEAKGETK